MARARNIKPSIMDNDQLAELEPLTRLLFVYLWMLADREGRLEDRPKRIAAQALPYDRSADVDSMLNDLKRAGFIQRYVVDGIPIIQIIAFAKHQTPHVREADSELPGPEEAREKAVASIAKGECLALPRLCQGDAEASPGSPDTGYRIPDSNTSMSPAGDPLACPVEEIIALYHAAMPGNPRVKVATQARRGAIKARWREASRLDCKPFGYGTRADGLAAWRSFFEVCGNSEFLTGRAEPSPGKPPFFADIDFLMSPKGFAKILENKYHRRAA